MSQICCLSERSDVNAMRVPSGDHRGEPLDFLPLVNWRVVAGGDVGDPDLRLVGVLVPVRLAHGVGHELAVGRDRRRTGALERDQLIDRRAQPARPPSGLRSTIISVAATASRKAVTFHRVPRREVGSQDDRPRRAPKVTAGAAGRSPCRRRAILLLAVMLAGVCARARAPAQEPPGRVPGDPAELRAVWVDAFHAGIRSPEEAAQLVADATRVHLNTLIVQVRRRGDALYVGRRRAAARRPRLRPLVRRSRARRVGRARSRAAGARLDQRDARRGATRRRRRTRATSSTSTDRRQPATTAG